MKRAWLSVVLFLAYACRTTAPAVPKQQIEVLHGVASWYGQEFAGRTTANGEIFDPMLLTAAHRSLPFGTVLEVKNAKNNKIVRVRVNDRGPYVGDRLIDLSYAAAKVIDLIEPGSGEVDLNVVSMGKGDREPPVPLTVTVAEAAPPPVELPVASVGAPAPGRAPAPVPQPTSAPEAGAPTQTGVATQPAVVDQVQVIEEHRGVETRKQVAPNGKTIETVPVQPAPVQPAPAPRPAPTPAPAPKPSGKFLVQVGAFADAGNAAQLQQRLQSAGFDAFIDKGPVLHKVQIGPFETRDEAVKIRSRLETAGLSAIILTSAQTR
jgi:rare lipoprotein A